MMLPGSALPARESPAGKRVALFVTCLADALYAQTGMAVVRLLEHAGVEVDFPRGQTCCGQPAFNSGYWHDARQGARHFLRVFQDAEVIVAPSGSCAAMIRHEYPRLFDGDPWRALAEQIAGKTWEFTEFLVDGLGIDDLGLGFPEPRSFAFHDSCHGLRLLGLGRQARVLLGSVRNATLAELTEHDECCGFGGTFSVKMADVSGAMLRRKLDHIGQCSAETIVLGDLSCMAQINGGLARQGSTRRARHIADILADGLAGARSRAESRAHEG